ncbi:MAG: NAD(P)-dependent glycerol-3-phosphate dehydrogenase [Chitinophagaceae bacterium]|nr:MAG: NAD(P)-dependent glycerol-3-phosphate dehydrogenase [Chitinophagaceae bacterium]
MNLKNTSEKPVGVIGAGSFGTAIANLLAVNNKVYLYARREAVVENINTQRLNAGQKIHPGVTGTGDIKKVVDECTLLFPTVPASTFRDMIKDISPFLNPSHILIHGTKGLDVNIKDWNLMEVKKPLPRNKILTMSEIIRRESSVIRVGCMSGPNLAKEISENKPAATVIASKFEEVIKAGEKAIRSPNFQVYQNYDITGVELAGTLKNIIAIASGVLSGLDLGENAKSLLITKGLGEMIRLGVTLGGTREAFLGLAGIGDVIATSTSNTSRNYTVGYRLAKGETLEHILNTSEEVAEGVQTVRITKFLADYYKVRTPILQVVYKVLFENMPVKNGLKYLMTYPFHLDVDFL